MKKILKIALKFILIFIITGIVYLNLSFYYHPKFKEIKGETYNEDVYHQLLFLKNELHNSAGENMQNIYPEGFIFINSLYGLSWCNLIENLDNNSEIYKEGEREINWSFNEINSPKGKSIFSKNLPLEYGAFYRGWSNYLLGRKLMIEKKENRDSNEISLFKKNCNQISTAINRSKSPYLESYTGQTWPADITVAIASLSLYDKISEPIYLQTINDWIKKVKLNLDIKTGLIPHSVNAENGATIEGARGSSQSLMLIFLKEIDEKFAEKQFIIFKKIFLEYKIGLPGIREYPKGTIGKEDIDSGPVILNIGGAASIVGQRAMGKFNNWKTYEGLRNCIEGFGMAYTTNSQKKYIFGKLPMADAFIAWSNSIEKRKGQVIVKSNWRIYFQLISLLIVLICAYPFVSCKVRSVI